MEEVGFDVLGAEIFYGVFGHVGWCVVGYEEDVGVFGVVGVLYCFGFHGVVFGEELLVVGFEVWFGEEDGVDEVAVVFAVVLYGSFG